MIPNHLVYRAAAGIDQFLAELQRGDGDNYPDLLARAVLEAVAAEIWDEGWDVGRRLQGPNSNPYKRNEHA